MMVVVRFIDAEVTPVNWKMYRLFLLDCGHTVALRLPVDIAALPAKARCAECEIDPRGLTPAAK